MLAPMSWRSVTEIDWPAWTPVDRATLLFVVAGGRILLIREKRGLGAGKINGPGGRIEDGESALAGAVREVEEEIGVTPTEVSERGELSFQFVDGYSIHVRVFRAGGFRGEPLETDEAVPMWFPLERIPLRRDVGRRPGVAAADARRRALPRPLRVRRRRHGRSPRHGALIREIEELAL
jgi:8-oxo-dGTP diphosphatase